MLVVILVMSSISSGCVEETLSGVSGISEFRFADPYESFIESHEDLNESVLFESGYLIEESNLEFNWTLMLIGTNYSKHFVTNSPNLIQFVPSGGWVLSVVILNNDERVSEEISKEIYKIPKNTMASASFDCESEGSTVRIGSDLILSAKVRESLTINYTIESFLPSDPVSKLHFFLPIEGAGAILDERRGAGGGSWTFTGDQLNELGMNDGEYNLQLEITVESNLEMTSFSECSIEITSNYIWE